MIQASAATDYIATELNKLIQANQINGKLDKSKSSVSIYLRTKDPNNPPPKYFRGSDHHITHASLLLNKWKPWNSINISIEFNEPRYKANGKRKKNVWKQEVFQNEKGTIQPFDVDVYEYTAANLDEPDIPIIFEAIKNFVFTGSYTDPFANNPQKAAKYTHSPALIIPRVSTNISVDKNGNYIRANGDGVDYISENKNINCNRNMNKKLIRLTESDLHRIVRESVNKVLNEIGDTNRGQYHLGRAAMRRFNMGDYDKAGEIGRYAEKKRVNDPDYDLESSNSTGMRHQNIYMNGGDPQKYYRDVIQRTDDRLR